MTQLGGAFSGSGFLNGIFVFSGAPVNVRISRISVSGCMSNGISLSQSERSNVGESCTVSTIGGIGIYAGLIDNSSATDCSSYGCVANVISNSYGEVVNGNGNGIETFGTASFCRGCSQSGFAISAPFAIGCTVGSGTINSAQKHLGTP